MQDNSFRLTQMRLPQISADPNCDCGAAKRYTREYMYVPRT